MTYVWFYMLYLHQRNYFLLVEGLQQQTSKKLPTTLALALALALEALVVIRWGLFLLFRAYVKQVYPSKMFMIFVECFSVY